MKGRSRWVYGLLVAAALVVTAFFVARPRSPVMVATAQQDDFVLVVDLSERRLHVMENGQEVQSFPVAVGRPSYPTPTGSFRIRHITWNPSWVPPDSKWARHRTAKAPGQSGNPMGNVKMFFSDGGFYIHGTREYDSLGEPESHGCVRMANGAAVQLAQEVMAHGGKPMPESWYESVLDHFRTERQVYLSHPVPVIIRG